MNRRQLTHAAPLAWLAAGPATAAAWNPGEHDYDAAVQQIWRSGPLHGLEGRALGLELVRCATLAPSSHNTQCWRFAVAPDAITVLPDFSRRCPAVDPDDHHLFVSLGCATENLVQAALAHGLMAEPRVGADVLVADRHAEAIEAVRSGDAEGARRAIAADLSEGMDKMRIAVEAIV